jgi:glutathione synthase/RimK-type ligase-like ATP-grasp enzyme
MDSFGARVDLASLDVIWWRRSHFPQIAAKSLAEPPDAAELINRDSQAFIEGLFLTNANAAWINHPLHAAAAENKLVQLDAAARAGLSIPETLIGNRPEEIISFVRSHPRVIVKTVRGLLGRPLLTREVRAEDLADPEPLLLAPAIYQRYVEGSEHLRVLAFSEHCLGAAFTSHDVDSRTDLTVPIRPVEIDAELGGKIRKTLDLLQLRMGVVDLKVRSDGEPVFLEVNQQGQFLFLDAVSSGSFLAPFADYLAALS